MISDSELENVFDDNLRVEHKKSNKRHVLGEKTNKNSLVQEIDKISSLEPKLDFSYNLEKNNVEDQKFMLENNLSFTKPDKDNSVVIKHEDLDHVFEKLNLSPAVKEEILNVNITNDKLNFDKNRKEKLKKIINKYTTPEESVTTADLNSKTIIPSDVLKLNSKIAKIDSTTREKVSINEDKINTSPSESILNTIEYEFNELKETHKKMLAMRNKILKMLEKEIEIARNEMEDEKKGEIKKLIDKYEKIIEDKDSEIAVLRNKFSQNPIDFKSNLRKISDLKFENKKLKDENERLNRKFKIYKIKCKEGVLKYKNSLDKLYRDYVNKLRIKYRKNHL